MVLLKVYNKILNLPLLILRRFFLSCHIFLKSRKLEFLGNGKDGIVYLSRTDPVETVKFLSRFGRKNQSLTREVTEAFNDYYGNKVIKFTGERIISRLGKLKHLNEIGSDNKINTALINISAIQIFLLKRNLIAWDYGFSDPNYMFDADNRLFWTDTSGSGFCRTDRKVNRPGLPNIERITSEILVNILLAHIARWHLNSLKFSSLISQYTRGYVSHEFVRDALEQHFSDCGLNIRKFYELDLLSISGWESLRKYMEDETVLRPRVFEKADFQEIKKENGKVSVFGYQNYTINRSVVQPMDTGHGFANTQRKFDKIDEIFERLSPECETYLDIGSNLGLYVFHAALRYKLEARGVDYNLDYVKVCRQISDEMSVDAQFDTSSFMDIQGTYDIVSLFAVVHHLYGRTEAHLGFSVICKKLSDITSKHCVVEFPNENDAKGRKWSSLSKDAKKYSESEFVKEMSKYFPNHQRLTGIIRTRPFYIFSKY